MTEFKQPDVDSAIAIIGLGGCFPGSKDVDTFWKNICEGHVAIKEVPKERWDPALYWSEDRSYPDRTYSRIGGFIEHIRFDRKRFRIPPRTLDSWRRRQPRGGHRARSARVRVTAEEAGARERCGCSCGVLY